jgi:hypothetical protein
VFIANLQCTFQVLQHFFVFSLAVHPSNLLSEKQALSAWWQYFHWSFLPHCPSKIPKRNVFALGQHFPPWEACHSASCVF